MTRFSVKECEVLWVKKRKIPEKDKQDIKKDLLSMSDLIEEALNYSKERAYRWTAITYELNTDNPDISYTLGINYEPALEAWLAIIDSDQGAGAEVVGEVISEKWSLGQLFLDEDYEAPEKIEI